MRRVCDSLERMDDLLGVFGLGRAITLTVAIGVAIAAFFTAPIDAQGPPPAAPRVESRWVDGLP
jgi:hypothetical protein